MDGCRQFLRMMCIIIDKYNVSGFDMKIEPSPCSAKGMHGMTHFLVRDAAFRCSSNGCHGVFNIYSHWHSQGDTGNFPIV